VPVAQLHLIGRYTGVSADEAPLHRLGSRPVGQGARARPPSRCATPRPSCSNLYARRAAREGHAFRFSAARLRGLRRPASASRRPPTSAPPSTR
jgi:transcription-repair coupling factor (superfamily II helicase)